MSDYTQVTAFTPKDSLVSGNPAKVIKGSEFDAEFAAISTSLQTKADKTGAAFTGNISTTGNLNVSGNFQVEGTVTGIDKTDVGLSNVDNTSDANKPVSTAQQAAIDLKLNAANPSYTGTLTGGTGVINIGSGQFYKDASGNVGLGVVPSAWDAGKTAMELANGASFSQSNGYAQLANNAYLTASGWVYKSSAKASLAAQYQGQHLWFVAPSGTAGDPISFTQAMVLDASGNFATGGPPQTNIRNALWGAGATSATHSLVCYNSSGFAGLAVRDDRRVAMGVNEAVIVDTSGNLLVGTTSGDSHYFKKSNTSAAVFGIENSSPTSPSGLFIALSGASPNNTSDYMIRAQDSGAARFVVWSNGNVVNTNNSYGAISDLKLKENITDASPKLAKLMQVRIVNYTLKADPDKTKLIGVIAQELEQISPGLIEETPDYEEVKKTREVTKTVAVAEKTLVKREQKTTEVVGGKAIVKTEWIEELADVPVIDHFPLFDESGQPVLEVDTPEVPAVTDADGNVTHPAVPATYRQARHSVPRMHEVTEIETYTERVPTGAVTKSVKYSVFLPMLIKGMQEQQAQIEAMQSQIDEQNTAMQLLTARLEALEAK